MHIQLNEHIQRNKIITLSGRVDIMAVPALRTTFAKLLAEGHTHFVINLHQMHFMDSAGLSALIMLLKKARTRGGNVTLVMSNSSETVRIFKLTHFDKIFTFYSTLEEALRLCSIPYKSTISHQSATAPTVRSVSILERIRQIAVVRQPAPTIP